MPNDNLILLNPSDLISDSRETINYDFLLLDGLFNRFMLANETLIGPPGIIFKGTYSPTFDYTIGDGVLYGNSTYVSLVEHNTGNQPDISPTQWQLVALGDEGPTGPTGASGVAGTNGSTGATGASGVAGTNGATGASGTSGINGATGPTGPAGSSGSAGVDGITGATGPQGASLLYRGTWNSLTTYDLLNMVEFSGQAYVALTGSNTNLEPDMFPSNWAQITITVIGSTGPTGPGGGATGATGASGNGATGATGPVGATGSPGSGTGTDTEYILVDGVVVSDDWFIVTDAEAEITVDEPIPFITISGELMIESGTSGPPVALWTEDGTDFIYEDRYDVINDGDEF